MIKELFPLKTFQQDAVLKRLDELAQSAQSEEDVESLVEGGTLDNAKPIYWHGCEVYSGSGQKTDYISFHILNNSPTPFTVWSQIANLMKSTAERFVLQTNGTLTINSVTYDVISIYKRANENLLNIGYKTPTGYDILQDVNLDFLNQISFNDGVNKIN